MEDSVKFLIVVFVVLTVLVMILESVKPKVLTSIMKVLGTMTMLIVAIVAYTWFLAFL